MFPFIDFSIVQPDKEEEASYAEGDETASGPAEGALLESALPVVIDQNAPVGPGEEEEYFGALFSLCAKSKVLEDAKKVHDYFLQSTCRGDLQLNIKVIEMYSKCGSMTDARRVFDHMPERNMESWHLMINGYAANALGDNELALYENMRNMGLQPNEQTFLAVLSACASAEAVDEGFIHFESMKTEYGIAPGIEHYL
ncbi:hypothetical protein U1Q18_003959 [Sarracenia purpurea var. burkii]